MQSITRRLSIAVLMASSLSAMATTVELAGQSPYTLDFNGVQADGGTGSYTQSFSASVNSTLEKIVWWGYRGEDESNGGADGFEILLDGVSQLGTISAEDDGSLIKYTLDVPDEVLTASFLSIQNVGDFEWYWQGSTDAVYSDGQQFPVAFSLLGSVASPIPEPETYALMLLGLAVIGLQRRTNR
jgi:hypothetical protein